MSRFALYRAGVALASLTLFLACTQPARAAVRITEFMAANSSTLADEDGAFEDWIEIYNDGVAAVNLDGWYLTDAAGSLTKWRFPATNINAGAFIVVFASNKDRRVPGLRLHTNFRLSNNGEYLALVLPDGVTIASSFPSVRQFPNVSYGFGADQTNYVILATNAPARVLIPLDGSLGSNWLATDFDDASWTAGTNGVGYETGVIDPAENSYASSVLESAPLGYWRFTETSGATATNAGSLGAAGNGAYQNAVTLGVAGPRPPQFGGFEAANTAAQFDGTKFVSTTGNILSGRGAFTIMGWIRPTATQAARTGLFGQNDAVEFGFISATMIQIWTPGGGSLDVSYSFPINEWHHITAVGDGTTLRVYFDGNLAGTGGGTTANYGTSASQFNVGGGGIFDATGNQFVGQIDEVAAWSRALAVADITRIIAGGSSSPVDYTPYLATDVRTAMHTMGSSAYIRLPFVLSNAAGIDQLTLKMRYDDGFAAYLNGFELTRANAPVSNEWNSVATSRHPDGQAVVYETIDVTVLRSLLLTGTNVLAIHGLNIHATNTDFLIQAELSAASVGEFQAQARYFTVPSPGGLNGFGQGDLGPIITDIAHTPEVPTDVQDVLVTARVEPAFNPITNVTLRYRIMFNAEVPVLMNDGGTNGDAIAGDGLWSAVIPASASTNGQMIRYFVSSADSLGRPSRWPLYPSTTDSEQYLGTIVANPGIESMLPVIHLFVENTAAAGTTAGTRCSIFYQGEFYDNILTSLRGQSSSTFPKTGFNFDTPADHRFLYREGKPRQKDFKLITNYGDKAKLRNALGYEMIERAGSAGHFCFQVRVQRNGVFYSVADFTEDADDVWLERLGRDPNGALYKMYNNLSGTGGNEKKTRREESFSDLQALVTALDETRPILDRATYAYDNIDLPQAVSYCVASALLSHQDHGHKNYYLYRDSDGNREWAVIPWDIDLSWGRTWTDAGGYFTDVLYQTNSLTFYNPSQQNKGSNRFYNIIFNHPDFRRMYLRRLTTVRDELLGLPGTAPQLLAIDKRLAEMMDLLDPPGVGVSDADLDYNAWPKWGNNNPMRPEAQRILDIHLPGRRSHLFSSTNAVLNGERLPASQPPDATLLIGQVEFNPASGNQAQEFICLTNPNPYALDISGWKLDGGVEFKFRPGTVISSNSVLYVSPDVNAFRARTTGPRGGQRLYVQGPYQGQLNARGEPLTITDARGRLVVSNNFVGAPSLAQQFLRISEIMYHPAPLAGNTNDADAFEYLELKNVSPGTILSLTGVRLTNGVDFNFTGSAVTSLAPGARVLVVRNLAAFTARYGGGLNVAGQYVGALENDGERLRLLDASNEEIHDFEYRDTWYPITDGLGFSLVVVDENAEADAWDSPLNWRPSGELNGAPGAGDPAAAPIAAIRVNEVLTHSDLPAVDYIELFNPTTNEVQLGGWFLTDDFNTPMKYRITNGVSIPALGYRVFTEAQFNPMPGMPPSFSLSSGGDEVFVFSGHPAGANLTGYFHGYDFGAAENGVTFGPHVNSAGDEDFTAQITLTPDTANSGPKIGSVVITEIHYHPQDTNGVDNDYDEFIELQNISGADVSLFHPAVPTNTWRLRDGVDFDFPTNVTLAAGEFALVVNFDPADAAALAAFRSRFGVDPAVKVFGPYSGQLSNAEDDLKLRRPDLPEGGEVPYILVDRVHYRDAAPWPGEADGTGASLQRLLPGSYGNEPTNFVAAVPTAGAARAGAGSAPVITQQPAGRITNVLNQVSFSVVAAGTSPFRYQWRLDGSAIEGATNGLFTIGTVLPEDSGNYSVVVFNQAGATESTQATLTVVIPATLVAQPLSVGARIGSNVVFTVHAYSASPVTYQWRFNGLPLAGRTNNTLSITNVQLSSGGVYDVAVTDLVGEILSQPATLTILINPIIIQQPLGSLVTTGATVTLSVVVSNTVTLPLYYRWRRTGAQIVSNYVNERVNYFTITNATNSATYSVVVGNAAMPSGVLSANAVITLVADNDRDGLPDFWEAANGFNTNSLADASADADGDTMTNYEEYIAGTNPNDITSYLKVNRIEQGGSATIQFNAVSNRTYRVEYTDDVASVSWLRFTNVVATATNRLETVIDPAPGENRFYRLVTPHLE